MSALERAERKYRDNQALLKSLKPRRAEAKQNRTESVKAQQFVQEFCRMVQENTYGKFSELVTSCLRAVFTEPYTFRILFDKKRGKAEARPVFLNSKGNELDPLSECEGGAVDVAAFALRVAGLLPLAGQSDMVLFLDEPTKHLSRGNRPRFAKLVESLSKELNVQIILITHDPEMTSGRVISLE